MVSANTIHLVKSLDATDVIGKYRPLKKKGANWQACCPFHDEKSPSFTVNPVRGTYKCFGCGKTGDAIQFVMEHERLEFVEAVEKICSDHGIEIERTEEDAPTIPKEHRQLLALINKSVSELYEQKLSENAEAKEYLASRGFGEAEVCVWRIGYAPADGSIHRWGVANAYLDKLMELGLVKIGEESKKPYDFFRNRIMFPIIDHKANVVAFSGRIFNDDKKAKYINSEGSVFYNKSAVLFGLYQSITGIKQKGFAILVEGYTDVISMHKAGADNTVAACGTSLTELQAKLLKKYTDEVIIMRDGDPAGFKALQRDVPIFLKEGFTVRVHLLKDGQDPDDFAKNYSA